MYIYKEKIEIRKMLCLTNEMPIYDLVKFMIELIYIR